MPRHPRKSHFNIDAAAVPTGVATGRALIWIDSSPLLKAEQTKLRTEKKKLSATEDRVRLHRQSDEPDYQLWFNSQFAERLAEIRELYTRLAELDAIVWKVEREILATGCSAIEAYEAVMQMAEDEASSEPQPETETETDSSSESAENDESRNDEDDEADRWHELKKNSSRSNDRATDDLLKQVYRSLVRKLHPDLNPDLSATLRERWFEVQQAYADRDLARLEMLLAACEDGDEATDDSFIDKIESLSRLRLLLKSVAKKLKASRRQLAQFKATPAWEFHKVRKDPRRLAGLERDVKFELRNAEETLSSDIRTLESQIERWKNPPPDRSRGRQRRDWNLSF